MEIPAPPGFGGHSEVLTPPGSGVSMEIPTLPGSGGHSKVPDLTWSKKLRISEVGDCRAMVAVFGGCSGCLFSASGFADIELC